MKNNQLFEFGMFWLTGSKTRAKAVTKLDNEEDRLNAFINILHNDEKSIFIAKLESDELRKKYLLAITDKYQRSEIITGLSDDMKIRMLDTLESDDNYNISKVIGSLSTEELQLEYLPRIKSDHYKTLIIQKFKNIENLKKGTGLLKSSLNIDDMMVFFPFEDRLNYILTTKSTYSKTGVIASLKEDETAMAIEYINGHKEEVKTSKAEYEELMLSLVSHLKKDENKVKYYDFVSPSKRWLIVRKFKSDKLKYEYLKKEENITKLSSIASSMSDEYKMSVFELLPEVESNSGLDYERFSLLLSTKSDKFKYDNLHLIATEGYYNALVDSITDPNYLYLLGGIEHRPFNFKSLEYYYEYATLAQWKNRSSNNDLYNNLSLRICTFARLNSITKTMAQFKDEFSAISKTLGISKTTLRQMIGNFKQDEEKYLDSIIELCRQFNIKAQADFSEEYKKTNIKKLIDSNFEFSRDVALKELKKIKQKEMYLSYIYDNPVMFADFFKKYNMDKNYSDILPIILFGNDETLLEELGISKPKCYSRYGMSKDLNRLKKNYSNAMIDRFDSDSLLIIRNYFNGKMSSENLKNEFSTSDLKFIHEVEALVKSSSARMVIKDNNIFWKVSHKETNDKENREVKNYDNFMHDLKKLKNDSNRHMNSVCGLDKVCISDSELDDYISNLPRDTKYLDVVLKKPEEGLNGIFKNNYATIKKYYDDDGIEGRVFRKLFIEEGLLDIMLIKESTACLKLLDNISALIYKMKEKDITVKNFKEMYDVASAYGYIKDETQRVILGDEIINKITSSDTFIGDCSSEAKRKRIDIAVDLNILSQSNYKSTIPYISVGTSIKACNYKSNDPSAFIAGIDTNACFRINGNENDFLIYTITNADGTILKITDNNGNFIGRCSGFRNGNTVFFNEGRTIYDVRGTGSSSASEGQKMIRSIVKEYAKTLVEVTKDSEYPIENVLILKCYSFSDEKDAQIIGANYISSVPMNVNSSHYNEFVENKYLHNKSPMYGFTVDYGSFPVVVLATSKGKIREKTDIVSYDVPAIYERPRDGIKECSDGVKDIFAIARVNRINAYNCYLGTEEEQYDKRCNYEVASILPDVNYLAVGEDWYYMIKNNGEVIECVLPFDERAKAEFEDFKKKSINSSKSLTLKKGSCA